MTLLIVIFLILIIFVSISAYRARTVGMDELNKQKPTKQSTTLSQKFAKATKMIKSILNKSFDIISSVFWWGVLIGMLYLIVEFGVSMYKGVSDFFSTPTTVAPVSVSVNRIVDGDYVPDKTDGTYLFTLDTNKTYRIKVSGCNLQVRVDGVEYNTTPYTVGSCSDGKDTAYGKKWNFTKGFEQKAIMPNEHWALAILVVKKGGKIIKKLPVGGNLYTLRSAEFPNNAKLYLFVNLSIHETVESGEWHVTVDEI